MSRCLNAHAARIELQPVIAAANVVTFPPTFRKWREPMHAPILQSNVSPVRAHHQDGFPQHRAMKKLSRIGSRYLMVPGNYVPAVPQPAAMGSRGLSLSINLRKRKLRHSRSVDTALPLRGQFSGVGPMAPSECTTTADLKRCIAVHR
jgi:hypothetical protein